MLWIYLAFHVIVTKQYWLYIPNSKFHDPSPNIVCHNLMKTAPKFYGNRGSGGVLLS